jgi:DNA-binding NtrC family response regulator
VSNSTRNTDALPIPGLIGSSAAMRALAERVRQIAPTDLTALITGESGTGKEVVARALHSLSLRRRERLVSLNCGAIPETLLESELFGSEKGAYTGATELRKGFFEAANKGTIFLDELGEMPLGTQVKLLRVLENGEFSRLGSPDTLRTDVRVIAATNRALEEEVARGRFRRDLFYRLNAVQLRIPPLRERPEDIPELIEYFAKRAAAKIGASYGGITQEALELLMNLPWNGNVRELRNLIETLVTLEKGREITIPVLRPYLPRELKPANVAAGSAPNETTLLHDDPASTRAPNFPLALPSAPVESPFSSDAFSFSAFLPEGYPQPLGAVRALLPPASEATPGGTYEQTEFPPYLAPNLFARTPERLERELLYKALVDLAREVALLRGEVTELKEAAIRRPNGFADGNGANDVLHSAHDSNNPSQTPHKTWDEVVNGEEKNFLPTMIEVEKRLIKTALQRFNGNRRLAADALGISERTLYRKLREYGLSE